MTPEFKPSGFDNLLCAVAPERGIKRLAARRILHEFRYDGAKADTKRGQAPHNMSPNSFDVQRDRLQLMREAEDMERNFAPAKMLNKKFALYTTPQSYHAQTGDQVLDKEVEEYLEEEAFPNCDITGRYGFYRMLEFGVMGCNRGGDYGWAFQRPGSYEGISEDAATLLPLKIQAIEPDRIGGIYQNVVSNDYVSGLNIGEYGQIDSFRVFHRSMTANTYDNPIDVPSSDFVHLTDPMRIDQYRGVSVLATAIQNLRDLYEMIDFIKGKSKLASALTVFTNSDGANVGNGAFDAYSTNLTPGGQAALQQDISFGQINHLPNGTDIKFPASSSPSSEEQWLMTQLLKFVAMSYDLPYSFALDASALGGVSSRLESEMAKATFERFQKVITPHANRIKNAFLYDAIAKGIFPVSKFQVIHKGRWGYRSHPQPDIGKEASAAVNLMEHGMLNPMQHWIDGGQDPETVAASMVKWALIKKDAAEKAGIPVEDIFGSGPSKPLSTSESITETVNPDVSGAGGIVGEGESVAIGAPAGAGLNGAQISALNDLATKVAKGEMPISSAKSIAQSAFPTISPDALESIFQDMEDFVTKKAQDAVETATAKEFSRKNYREADSSITERINKESDAVEFGEDWVADIKEGISDLQDGSNPEALQRLRVELDKANSYLAEHKASLAQIKGRKDKRDDKNRDEKPTPEARVQKAKKRDDRHALTEALKLSGKPEQEAYAIAYDIIEKGEFDKSKLPAEIQKKYYP